MEGVYWCISSRPHTRNSTHLISEKLFLTSHLLINNPLEQIEVETFEMPEVAASGVWTPAYSPSDANQRLEVWVAD